MKLIRESAFDLMLWYVPEKHLIFYKKKFMNGLFSLQASLGVSCFCDGRCFIVHVCCCENQYHHRWDPDGHYLS